MNHVYILGGLRSYIGVKDGMYRHIPAEKLGAEVLREVVSRFELPTDAIDYIIGGNAVGGGGNITRLAALSAGVFRADSGGYFGSAVRVGAGGDQRGSSQD